MSLETLLQAAEFLEQQEIQKKAAHEATREEYQPVIKQEPSTFQPPPPSTSNDKIRLPLRNDHHSYSSRQHEEGFEIKRRSGAGTREVHNKLEKNRRAHLKECFELLKRQLPASQDEKKASNLNILHSALRFIQTLRRKEREFEHEMERLAREKIALQQKFAGLKKELITQWDHLDFNTLIPDMFLLDNLHTAHSSNQSDHEEVMVTSDNEEVLHNRSIVYSSTSSLSSAATTSISPLLPPPPLHQTGPDERHSPGTSTSTSASPKHFPLREEMPKLISYSRRDSPKRASGSPASANNKPTQLAMSMPVSTSILSTGQSIATFVSQPIQLVAPTGIRMLSADQSLALSLSHPSSVSPASGVTLVSSSSFHKAANSDGTAEGISLIPANGIRGKTHPIGLAIPNGVLGPGLTAKNGTIYKQHSQTRELPSHLASAGITHVVAAPLGGGHGTLVTPVPVTVVSQGSQVAHILTASPHHKVMTPLSLKSVSSVPIVNQYLVKQGTAMVVVSQSSAAPSHSS